MNRSDITRILINSYSCCPDLGSEPGMGWNWIVSLAQYCECFVISEGEFRHQVEKWLTIPNNKNIASHLHFYWLPIGGEDNNKSEHIRQMCRNQGDWRFYYFYRLWQKRAAICASEIVAAQEKISKPIQILHHLNMIGFREPGYLWRVSHKTGIPLVWGPINAKQGYPMAYVSNAPLRLRLFLFLKNSITRFQLLLSPRVRCMANTSSVIIAASSDAQQSISRYWHKESICINETGSSDVLMQSNLDSEVGSLPKDTFDILWCGRLYFGKHLELAIRAVSKTNLSNMVLHVVGGGEDHSYRELADKIGAKVVWYGQIPHSNVQEMMRKMDLLLFTSVFEGTPHVVLEAISNRLPVVCFKTCGQGDVVTNAVGATIPISSPEQSSRDFANVLIDLWKHPEIRKNMQNNCLARAKELSWDNKAKQMLEIYKQCCKS